jgi:chromosome segregation ATPase
VTQSGEETAVVRPDEDDHDLLTFGEAGARLEIEIRTMRTRVRELETAEPRDEAAVRAAKARLSELEEGAERNRAQSINDENFEKFFGYPGQARRNTTW